MSFAYCGMNSKPATGRFMPGNENDRVKKRRTDQPQHLYNCTSDKEPGRRKRPGFSLPSEALAKEGLPGTVN